MFHDRAEVSRSHNLKLVSALDLKNSMVMWLSASSVLSLDHTKPLRRLGMQMWSSLRWTPLRASWCASSSVSRLRCSLLSDGIFK